MRTIGLAWRRTSARKGDFMALGGLIKGLRPEDRDLGKPARA
ncbi:hypothetical protein [Microvirga aerilata]|nr:hypothetical protein [Microvirga aerilata]